jgi:hypothetical protein
MRITISTCDRCGRTASTDRIETIKELDLQKVSIVWGALGYQRWSNNKDVEWCMKCRVELGLQTPSVAPSVTPIEGVTLEDLVREVAREEAESVVSELVEHG